MPRSRKSAPPPPQEEAPPAQTPALTLSEVLPHQSGPQGGRPLLLTADRRQRMLEAIRLGLPVDKAVALVGISARTWHNWMNRAKDPDAVEFWREFGDEIAQAQAEGTERALRRIHEAGQEKQHWTAMAWLLERTDPAHFGRTQTVTVNYRRMSDDEFSAALDEAGLGGLVIGPAEAGAP